MKLVASFALLASLIGCATLSTPGGEAVEVPWTRQMLFRESEAGTGTVSITRDSGYAGSSCPTSLFVNDKMAALVRAGETVTLHLPAEPVSLGAIPFGTCGGGMARMAINPTASKSAQYRIGSDGNGEIDFFPVVRR